MNEKTHEISSEKHTAALTFLCPGCGEEEFPDEAGVVTCECGAHIETLEPLGMRRILANYWTRLRGSVAPAIPPDPVTKSARSPHNRETTRTEEL